MRWIALLLLVVTGWLVFQNHQAGAARDKAQHDLETQTAYLCSTTHVLDSLVVAAARQIRLNFRNGTYLRLLRQGVLTQDNVQAARDTLEQYEASHALLSDTEPCQGVEG